MRVQSFSMPDHLISQKSYAGCFYEKSLLCFIVVSLFLYFPVVDVAIGFDDADLQRLQSTNQCPGCNLTGIRLSEAKLPNAKLSGANISSASISNSKLPNADFSGANLSYINLTRADLTGANMSNADLRVAILTDAKLEKANLSNANLSGAALFDANLTGANLDGAMGYTRATMAVTMGSNGASRS